MIQKLKQYRFLFSQLVKRDFTKKYKRTILGMAWSIISPLMNLLIMWVVFNKFFGSNVNHYVIYLFAGQLVFSYFTDATNLGMNSLVSNAGIFTKINIPKYLFLFSQNVSSLINLGLTLLIFFIFVAIDGRLHGNSCSCYTRSGASSCSILGWVWSCQRCSCSSGICSTCGAS